MVPANPLLLLCRVSFFIVDYIQQAKMAKRVLHFSPGEEVEVGNSEKGSWYTAKVLRKIDRPSRATKNKVFVEYQTLMADKKGVKPLRENVNLSRLRPKRSPLPQEEEEADRSYQVDEKVEAFDHDGWWEGVVTKVLEDQRYRVYFEECDQEFEYHKSLLRRHFEWVDGRWVCEGVAYEHEQQTMKPVFTKGDSIEVRVDSGICSDAWFPATVLKQTSSKRFLVELQASHNPLLETVDSQHIRPLPPQMAHVNAFQLSEKVDALYDWRWWSGVINKILSGGRYVVFFKSQNKLKEFVHSDLRFHMDWVDGKWFRDSKEISITPHDQTQNESPGHVQSGQAGSTDLNMLQNDMANSGDVSKNLEVKKSPSSFRISSKQTLEPIFSRERLVEVCLDGDTCYGAWFPATMLKEIDNNHLLVEFHKLKSHARAGILKKTVESRYIRPFPPQTSHVKSYQLLDKVDAFYDGGWWSGLIKRIIAGSRYTVSFKHQNKLKEFSHSELRIHMDWTNGQWSENSKEISVAQHNQCGTESRREALSEEAVNTDQIIDLVSPLGLDATKNVAVKTLPIQTQQDRKTFQCTDVAHPSSGNAVKTVASKKSHSPRISRKMEYQLSSKKSCSAGKTHNVDAAKKISSEKSPSCLSGKEVKAPISLKACPVRGMSMGSSAVNKIFLAHCSKDQPEPLNSGQDKKKHDLESNGPKNLHSVEGCSSHLPHIIDIIEDTVVESPKLQTLAQQMKLEVLMPRQKRKPLGDDDIEQQEMEGVSKQKNAFDRRGQTKEKVLGPLGTKATVKGVEHQAGKSQTHDARIETQTEGPEHTSASKTTTTFVVEAEDKCKEIEMDGASKDNRDSDPHISMCIEESYFPSSIDETGVSSANQPMVQAMEADALMSGLELQNPLNVTDNSYRLEGTTVVNQPDEAIEDQHYEHVMQSKEDEGLPFIKCSPLWDILESNEVFRAIPQRLHFDPVKQFNMELREGLAIGSMVNFISIVEKIEKADVDDPLSVLQDRSKALGDLKAYGFNVQPIQARLQELVRLKEKQGQLNSQLVEAEERISEKQQRKVELEIDLEETDVEVRNIQECLNELKKKWNSVVVENENQGSKIDELKTTVNRIRERIQCAELEFNSVVASPWSIKWHPTTAELASSQLLLS